VSKGINEIPVTYNTIMPECLKQVTLLSAQHLCGGNEGLFILLLRHENKDEIVTWVLAVGSPW